MEEDCWYLLTFMETGFKIAFAVTVCRSLKVLMKRDGLVSGESPEEMDLAWHMSKDSNAFSGKRLTQASSSVH
jgi:hypothetical protein